MQRTQISLTAIERRLLDAESERTGRSLAALIRDAVRATYGPAPDTDDDLEAMRTAFGSWTDRANTGADWVDEHRSGIRLIAHER